MFQIIYHFSNTWFVAFKAKRDTRTMWNKKQRFMYLRLRRIVNAHSIMMTKSKQFKRELRMRNFVPINKKPRNSIYSGGGMPHNTFFYYGVMNSGKLRGGLEISYQVACNLISRT